jgi:hypothetical protein
MKLNFKIQVLLNKFKILAVIVENIDLLRDCEFLLVTLSPIIINRHSLSMPLSSCFSKSEKWRMFKLKWSKKMG